MSVPFYVVYKDFRHLGGYHVRKCNSKEEAVEFVHEDMQDNEEDGIMVDPADYVLIEGYRYEVYNELKVRPYRPFGGVNYGD